MSALSEKTCLLPKHAAKKNVPSFVGNTRTLPNNEDGTRNPRTLPRNDELMHTAPPLGNSFSSADLKVNENTTSVSANAPVLSNCEDEINKVPVPEIVNSRHLQNTLSSESETFKSRFYTTISIILVVFKGCEEMAGVTLKQFVYSWCENETVSSDDSNRLNDTSGNNSTDACGHMGSKVSQSEAQKMASRWELYFNLLNTVLVFFSVSICGTLSDYFGRKPFLCTAFLGFTLKCGTIAAVIYFDLHIAWILLAYGIDGLCGSSYAVSLFTYASTADITSRSGSRNMAMSMMEMVLNIGRFSTQFGNGYFIHQYGYFYPMLTATIGTSFCVMLTLLTFKETNTAILDLPPSKTHCPTCTVLVKRYTSFYVNTGSRMDKIVFWLCLAVFVLFEIALQGRSDPLVLYQLGSPFCWSSEVIGWYGTVTIGLWYVVGLLLLKPLRFCLSTNTIACFGITSAISCNVVTGLAPSTLWIFIATGFGLIMGLPKPILRGLVSIRVSETEQGAMFAGLQSCEVIFKLVSSPGSLAIYSATLDTFKGMVFFVLAGVDALGLVFMMKQQSSDDSNRLNDTSGNNSTDACGHMGSKVSQSEAQKMASRWELYFNLLNTVLVFFSVSICGTLSDYFGRKPFLCTAFLGFTLKCGTIAAVIYFDLHIAWILLAYGIDGLCGSSYAVSLFTYASTADITSRSGSRNMAMSMMEMVLNIGRFSTQFGNGYFIHQYGYFYPMLTATIGTSFCVMLTLLTFKETNTAILDLPPSKTHCPTCTVLVKRYTSFYVNTGSRMDKIVFWLCLAVFVLFEIALQGRSDPLVLYQLGSPFCWSSEVIGWYGTVTIGLWYVVGLLLLKPLRFCLSTNTIACFGITSAISCNVVTGLAPSTLWIFIATGFGLIMGLPKPILRGLVSIRVSETEQGAMFAGLQSCEVIFKLVSSPGSLAIYSATLDTFKGMVFFVLAGVDALGLVFMILLTYILREQSKNRSYTAIQTTD